jgi:membrane protease YdiL (CAAX protease family)
MSDTPAPAFLAPIGEAERQPLRWLLMIVLSLLFAVGGAAVVGAGIMAFDPRLAELIETMPLSGPNRLIDETLVAALLAGILMAAALGAILGARIAFRRPFATFLSPAGPYSWKLTGFGVLVYGALISAALLLTLLVNQEPLSPPIFDTAYPLDDRVLYAVGSFPLIIMAATAEELFFRGLLLQLMGAVLRNAVVLAIVNGLVFSAMHFDPNPGAFVARALMGAVWAWAVLRLGGLEFGIGAHAINNLLLIYFVQPISSAVNTADYQVSAIAVDVVISAVTLAAITLVAKRHPRPSAAAAPAP